MIFYSTSGCERSGIIDTNLINESINKVTLIPLAVEIENDESSSSPFACHISTLANKKADYNYWNQTFRVLFPKEAIDKAEGRTTYQVFSYSNKNAGEKAGIWNSQSNIVRLAQCVLPDSKLAKQLMDERLRIFGKGTWIEDKASKSETNTSETSDWQCTEWFVTVVCLRDSETGELYNCQETDRECTEYTYYEDGDGGGGGGSGSEDPEECDPNGVVPCYNDGDGGSTQPPKPDPCDEEDHAWCDDPCETGDSIVDNTGVQETFEDQWNKSDTDKPIDQRSEQGGFLIENSNDEIGFIEFPSDWTRTPCGINPPSDWINSVPDNAIGYIHTHPFFEGEDTTSPQVCGSAGSTSYQSGQSQADVEMLAEMANHLEDFNIKGYMIDGDNIVTFTPLSFSGPEDTYQRCGY